MQRFFFSHLQRAALLLLVGFWSVLAMAQGSCPELKVSDFKVNYFAANVDCGTDGQIIVTYRNNVAGYSKLTYETSNDGATWGHPVEQTDPSTPTRIPLQGWSVGQTIHLRVKGTCPSGTQELLLPPLTHRSESSNAVTSLLETTPAGGCSATAGSMSVSLGAVSGFTKAEYLLYQGTTLLNTAASTTPYEPIDFYNLPSGTYKVVVRATPACPPSTPTPTFKNGAYEMEETVKVGYFSILTSPISTRNTCDGGVTVAVARVMGVNALKYEILQGGTILQNGQFAYPNFTQTFLSLPAGHYEVRATTNCGTVETVPFSVPVGTPGTLVTKVLQGTYAHCSIGKISATVPGTTIACPVNYTLTPDDGSTPITKSNITTESVVFENLAVGGYTLSATWAGQTQTATENITIESLGELALTSTNAEITCDPSGTLKVELKNGVYWEDGILLLSMDGTSVRSQGISATTREYTFRNLLPGFYTVNYRTSCGEAITAQKVVDVDSDLGFGFTFGRQYRCVEPVGCYGEGYYLRYTVEGRRDTPVYRNFIQGATFEAWRDGKLVDSGTMPTTLDQEGGNNIVLTTIGYTPVTLKILPACGTPVLTYVLNPEDLRLKETTDRIEPKMTKAAIGCTDTGQITFDYRDHNGNIPRGMEMSGCALKYKTDHTITLKDANGKTVYSNTTSNPSNLVVDNLPAGTYTWEYTIACDADFKRTGTVEVTSQLRLSYDKQNSHLYTCESTAYIYFTVYDASEANPVRLTLYDAATDAVVRTVLVTQPYQGYNNSNYTMQNLPYGKFYAVASPSSGCTAGEARVDGIEIEKARDNLYPFGRVQSVTSPCAVATDVKMRNLYPTTTSVRYVIYDQKGVELYQQTGATGLDEVTFSNVPIGTYQIQVFSPDGCASIRMPLNVQPQLEGKNPDFRIFAGSLYPGCRTKTKLSGKINLRELGYPDQATKVVLLKYNSEQGYSNSIGERIDSILSPNIQDTFEFSTLLSSGTYGVEYEMKGCNFLRNGSVRVVPITYMENYYYTSSISTPCDGGSVGVQTNMTDALGTFEFTLLNTNTGQTFVQTLPADGRERPTITGLPPGTYTARLVLRSECGELRDEKTGLVIKEPEPDLAYEATNIRCPSDGTISAYIRNGEVLNKAVYTLTRNSFTKTGNTLTPKERFKFDGLTPGTYTLQAITECGTGSSYRQYTKSISAYVGGSYTNLTAQENPNTAVSSPACKGIGALGIKVAGGISPRVYITRTPNGPVSPPQEIFQTTSSSNTWGKNLIPGSYDILVDDGCKQVARTNLTVPVQPLLAKVYIDNMCFRKTNGGKYWNTIRLDLTSYLHLERNIVKDRYEVAIVPTGGTRTGAWSSSWRQMSINEYYPSSSDKSTSCMDSTTVNILDPGGFDLLLRLKECPLVVTRVHFAPGNLCCPFEIWPYEYDCNHQQFAFRKVGLYDTYNIKLTNTTLNQVVVNKNVKYVAPNGYEMSFNDPDLITDDRYVYRLDITGPGGVAACTSTMPQRLNKQVYLRAGFDYSTANCNEGGYAFLLTDHLYKKQCAPPARFRLYDYNNVTKTRGGLVQESPLPLTQEWRLRLPRGRFYYLEAVDENNVPIVVANPTEHIVDTHYYTPDSYGHQSYTMGGRCNSVASWEFGRFSPYYSGTPRRPVPIKSIEIRHSSGVKWTTTEYTSSIGGDFTARSLKKFNPDGSPSSDVSGYPAGAYTFTIVDDCNTSKTGSFTLDYIPPVRLDLSGSTIVKECNGSFTITPKGRAYFPDQPSAAVTIVGYDFFVSDNPRYSFGQSFNTFDRQSKIVARIKFPDASYCTGQWTYNVEATTALAFDDTRTAAYFCDGTKKGQIYVSAKSGRPPYDYTLKDQLGNIVAQKLAQPGGVMFEQGNQGETYRVEITDACHQELIYQTVNILAPAEIEHAISQERFFCEGSTTSFSAVALPGATYRWTHPNGAVTTNETVSIVTSAATAGVYNLEIIPSQCTTRIKAKVTINVANVKERQDQLTVTLCAGETAHVHLPPSQAVNNGAPVSTQVYQWQVTTDPNSESSWRTLTGAVQASLDYLPKTAGTYYVRRISTLGSCSDVSAVSKIVATPGLMSFMSDDEKRVVIDHKNPFTITAGFLTGNPVRTYQWQRSLDKNTWTNITTDGTNETYTETEKRASVVYYRRITTAGTCQVMSDVITVVFKKRYPAMVNPHLRQRVLTE